MVEVRVSKYMLGYMLQLAGLKRHRWETIFGAFCQFPVEIPNFFWDVELYLRHGALPRRFFLRCYVPQDFPGLDGTKELIPRLRKHIMSSLYRGISLDLIRSNSGKAIGNGRILPLWPLHSDGFGGWEFAQRSNLSP